MKRKPECPECGASLPENTLDGVCPRCLLAVSLGRAGQATRLIRRTAAEGPGDVVGRYKLLEKIGEGGCGVVFMAEQSEPIQRKVALKVIKAGMDSNEVIARFEAERQALALMDHPNIARVLDGGATTAGRPFFVMELVRGIPITDYCDQGRLSMRERLRLFKRVCQAVQHAHQKGVIHRDIKPSNVMVTLHDGEPVPKVIDFGVAKALGQKLTERTLFTAFQHIIGTPAYMSPEQAALSGLDIDTRADVYSLGVLLYELLTGVTPFDAEVFRKGALDDIRRMILEVEPLRPSTRLQTLGDKLPVVARHRHTEPEMLSRLLRGDLDWIVMRCLEKDRKRRYETANGLAADVERHLSNEPVVARPPSSLYRFQKLVRRHGLAFASASAIAAALVLGLSISTLALLRAKEDRRRAVSAEEETAIEARVARMAANEARMTLASSDFLQAVHLVAAGNPSDAMPYLVRSLASNPTNAGALTRLATLLTHRSWMLPRVTLQIEGQVTGAEFSPDGKLVATCSGDAVRVWEPRTGRSLNTLRVPGKPIQVVQFSSDGRRIATASTGSVSLWEAQSAQLLGEFVLGGYRVDAMSFSLDGKRIVTIMRPEEGSPNGKKEATADDSLRVWEVDSGRPLTPQLQPGGRITSAQFSPDGKRIVTTSGDTSICVWDAATGRLLLGPLKRGSYVLHAEFSPDGKRIVTSGGSVSVWDAQSGELLLDAFEQRGPNFPAHFSPDGRSIAMCSDDYTVRVYDAQTGQSRTGPIVHDGTVDSLRFSADGKLILVISSDYSLFNEQANRWCKSARAAMPEVVKPWLGRCTTTGCGLRNSVPTASGSSRFPPTGQPWCGTWKCPP
jgi:eukaryotic-like serine/threonine-protein kinase